jgi:hypothetical protein
LINVKISLIFVNISRFLPPPVGFFGPPVGFLEQNRKSSVDFSQAKTDKMTENQFNFLR